MSSCYITLPYHIISYLMFFYFISSADLLSIPFHSIQFYFISNWFSSMEFYSLLLNSIYYIVQHSISHQWMIFVYLSVHPSACLSVCMNKFMFSLLSCFFILCFLFYFSFTSRLIFFSLLLLFLFSFLFLFSWTSSSRTHTDTDTHTYIHMNICSFLWLVHITSKARKWRIVFEW